MTSVNETGFLSLQAIQHFASRNPSKLWPTAAKMTFQIRCSGNVMQYLLPFGSKQTFRLDFKPKGNCVLVKTARIMADQYAANPWFSCLPKPFTKRSPSSSAWKFMQSSITFIALSFRPLPLHNATCYSSHTSDNLAAQPSACVPHYQHGWHSRSSTTTLAAHWKRWLRIYYILGQN